jgi:hypothetical protein
VLEEIADLVEPVYSTHDAEASASSDASASSYRRSEEVGILAAVLAELKFIQVERQVVVAYVVLGGDDPTLQQAPKALDVVSMNLAPRVLGLVVYSVVRKSLIQLLVARAFIRGDQANFVGK